MRKRPRLVISETGEGACGALWAWPRYQTDSKPAQARSSAAAPCARHANLYNCSDFSTQAEVQACYGCCVSQGAGVSIIWAQSNIKLGLPE